MTVVEHEAAHAQVAKELNGLYYKYCGQKDQGTDCPAVLSTGRATPKSCVQFWGLHYEKDIEVLERDHRRAMVPVKGLEHKSCDDW